MELQHIFLIVWVIGAAIMLAVAYTKGKKALEIFPELESTNIFFREKGASGNSMSSLKTRLGGAKNVLEIIVTNDELWIRIPVLFAGFGKMFDLLHKVKLTAILKVELTPKGVLIAFKSDNLSETILNLKMKKSQEFVEVILDKTGLHKKFVSERNKLIS